MTSSIPLPVGTYVTADPTASCKRLVNIFSEPAPPDSTLQELKGGNPYQESAPSYLRRWAGTTAFANDGTSNPVRGLWTMQGVLYAVQGPTLYSVSQTGTMTQLGTGISGSGFVRMTDNTACLIILVPNSKICYTYCPNATSPITLANVQITGTSGEFSCNATTTLYVGMQLTVSGSIGGTGVITGYVNPTIYQVIETDGSTNFTLDTLVGNPLVTTVGTTTGLSFTTIGGPVFQQLTAATFLQFGAIDLHFVDSYIVFLAQNGREFYNDDGQIVSGQNQITFNTDGIFPREFGTDLFVGLGVDHREISLFGLWTSEGYLNVGNPVGTPFSTAPQSFVELGCHPLGAYTIALQDQALFWVASDKTVRRKSGQTPQRISNSGIESILEHADLTGSYALTPNIAGHPLWALVMPAAFRTLVYDCLTTEWFEIESYGLGYWRALCYNNAYGRQFVGDSQGHGIGYLDTSVFTEYSDMMETSFTTQSIYKDHNRIVHRRLEAVMTTGDGGFTGANLSLYVSDDSGNTFRGFPNRNLGPTGSFYTRAVWFNLGQTRNRVYRFSTADPTPTFVVQCTTDIEMCKW